MLQDQASDEGTKMLDFFSIQAFRYVVGTFFENLGAKPESFGDPLLRGYLPVMYGIIQETKDWMDWDAYLRKMATIEREGWKKPHRRIHELKHENVIENDLDHLILGVCLVASRFDPRYVDDNEKDSVRALRTKAVLMFLVHEADELVVGDKTPDEEGYGSSKEAAIPLARKLLEETYRCNEKLLNIWDEFNAGETQLAQDIDFLDHETTLHKASSYDREFGPYDTPKLAQEFAIYYGKQHVQHRNVHNLEAYKKERMLRQALFSINGVNLNQLRIKTAREVWKITKTTGDDLEAAMPGMTKILSERIVRQFGIVLPE